MLDFNPHSFKPNFHVRPHAITSRNLNFVIFNLENEGNAVRIVCVGYKIAFYRVKNKDAVISDAYIY
jgi:hypothetical protein